MRSAAHSRRRNASGTWTRMPAPSPVKGSQPQAPRWVRFWRTVSAFWMMSCECSPLTFTTKPPPPASRSVRGSRSGFRMLRSPCLQAVSVPARPLGGCRGRRRGRAQCELHALGVRREDDQGLRPGDAVERPDLADQPFERRGVPGLHLEEERVLAGHVMTLEDVAQRRHLSLEVADPRRMADDHTDEGGDVEAEPPAVDDGAIAGDHAGRLELLDAFEDGGRAEPHLLAETHERCPAVLLEELQDAEINVVQLGGGALA